MLEQFVAMVVCAHKDGISVGVLKVQLLLQGMDEEECTLLIEIVALEVRASKRMEVVTPEGHIVEIAA